MSKHKGVNIEEVWDYRLSNATPVLHNSGEFWRVDIHPVRDGTGEPLESHVTDIPCTKGDTHDPVKIAACYDWLRTVRDKYSRDDIDEIKPLIAKYRNAQAKLHAKLAAGE